MRLAFRLLFVVKVLILFLLATYSLYAQKGLFRDSFLTVELVRTGNIHRPMKADESRSLEAREFAARVLKSQTLSPLHMATAWKPGGYGAVKQAALQSNNDHPVLSFSYPQQTGKRATGSAADPDYAVYGNASIQYDLKGENWNIYNRLEFFIQPTAPGARVVNINIRLNNSSVDHLINLANNQWNRCWLDLRELKRDQMQNIQFHVTLKGKDRTNGDTVHYNISDFKLLQIEEIMPIDGWQPGSQTVIYSTSGYHLQGAKTALIGAEAFKQESHFELRTVPENKIVYTAPLLSVKTTIGNFKVLDFSAVRLAGNYRLKIGNYTTDPFLIDSSIFEGSQWRVLNFIFCQRCGYAVPEKHGSCHADLFSKHQGKQIAYNGGWHDAGDLSQQTLQTADVVFGLLEAYQKQQDKNPSLAARLLEEAEWGLDFVVKNRFGDGFRASSMGLLIWQDGILGTQDDIFSVRVQDHAFDNFLYAGYEAFAAQLFNHDPAYAQYLKKIAIQDFDFAIRKFQEKGIEPFRHFYEHSFATSPSQFYATISWAASRLYTLTGEPKYADIATKHIRYTMACQRQDVLGEGHGISGFFYRDTTRRSIVHSTHQSREQVYMQALVLLCETQPSHADYSKWKKAIQLYGSFLKKSVHFTAPYGMIPSGVYHKEEAADSAAFYSLHLFPPDNAKELFSQQLEAGYALDEQHVMKRFPVWFSIFNGNEAILLAAGKSAALAGHFLKDAMLLQIGREQLYWTVGKNPFAQSLIYGEGNNFPKMDSFSSGEMTGEMPVGIRTKGNEDIPSWPSINNATYKEVWVTCAGKWLSLLAEYE